MLANQLLEKTYYHSSLPFVQVVAGEEIHEKKGILYKGIYHSSEFTVDLSPFPGFSIKTLEECSVDFEELFKGNSPIPEIHSNPHIEFACFQIRDQTEFEEISPTPILMNKVCPLEQLASTVRDNKDNHIKIKLGPSEKEIHEFLSLFKKLPKEVSLRIDGNTRWTSEALNSFWKELKILKRDEQIDYFEEPLNNYQDYLRLSPDIPFAHEEYLEEFLKGPDKAKAVVLKPSQVGISRWESLLRKEHLRVIISSAYETVPALSALKRLCLLNPNEYHGLNAYIENKDILPIKTVKL
ncbi:MAG: hypothetical protein K9K67_13430 [Bacteriovoracaceae bacterium]|nr:hypothetical protein [Bacteriovoracaceae bacterium]